MLLYFIEINHGELQLGIRSHFVVLAISLVGTSKRECKHIIPNDLNEQPLVIFASF